MVVNSDVLPRHGFTQMARNMRCQLYFPFPTEQVVLLRTGVLVHINAYMRSLGLTPPAADLAAASPAPPQHTRTGSHADAGPLTLKAQVANAGSAGLSDQGLCRAMGWPSWQMQCMLTHQVHGWQSKTVLHSQHVTACQCAPALDSVDTSTMPGFVR